MKRQRGRFGEAVEVKFYKTLYTPSIYMRFKIFFFCSFVHMKYTRFSVYLLEHHDARTSIFWKIMLIYNSLADDQHRTAG